MSKTVTREFAVQVTRDQLRLGWRSVTEEHAAPEPPTFQGYGPDAVLTGEESGRILDVQL